MLFLLRLNKMNKIYILYISYILQINIKPNKLYMTTPNPNIPATNYNIQPARIS